MIRDTLKNILSGRFPSHVLEDVVDSLLASDSELSLDDQIAVLSAGIDFVRNSEDHKNVTVGWKILKILENKPGVRFDVLLNAAVIEAILIGTEPPYNPQEVLELIKWCLVKDRNQGLESAVQRNLTEFLHSVSSDDKLLADMCILLSNHPECLPNNDELKRFCEALVACLSTFAMPAAHPTAVRQFQGNVAHIREFMKMTLKNNRERRDIIYSCLKIVYTAIANNDDGREPYPGLAVVLGLLEPDYINAEVQTVLSNSSSYEVVKKALQIFCNWLTLCPRETHVNLWIDALISGLEAQEMYGILTDVTLETIDKLFGAMQLPVLRNAVEFVVWRMLFSNLHCPEVFHKISTKIPAVVSQLKLESSRDPMWSLSYLCSYCYIMLDEFPNLKHDYDTVYKVIEGLTTKRMFNRSQLNIKQWCPTLNGLTPEFDTVLMTYQSTGRVGLHNLGNTCYMNSVLQALFMTNRFCFGLLAKEKNYCQQLIWKLQTLFALLLHSKRPALSPEDVLTICRPPGFLPGQQQDSSEFLTIFYTTN